MVASDKTAEPKEEVHRVSNAEMLVLFSLYSGGSPDWFRGRILPGFAAQSRPSSDGCIPFSPSSWIF